MSVLFKKATKKKCKLRLAICAPSGSGKTYGALSIATGLGGRIAVIDTEHGSAELYSDLFDYDVCAIEAPFSPDKYIEAIREAEHAGYDTIIIDSLSHAWSGTGGILDMQENAIKHTKGNSYTAWREVTPKHNALVDAMLMSKCHIIATMRSKTAYEMNTDSRGKSVPVKVGLAPVQRDGIDYEFTVVFDISVEDHICKVSKDRTNLFDGQLFKITTETGTKLSEWLNQGESYDIEQDLEKLKEAKSEHELKIYYLRCLQNAKVYLSRDDFEGKKEKIVEVKDYMKQTLAQAPC